jgi:hypothetical protein
LNHAPIGIGCHPSSSTLVQRSVRPDRDITTAGKPAKIRYGNTKSDSAQERGGCKAAHGSVYRMLSEGRRPRLARQSAKKFPGDVQEGTYEKELMHRDVLGSPQDVPRVTKVIFG